jgi:hypothetical protein
MKSHVPCKHHEECCRFTTSESGICYKCQDKYWRRRLKQRAMNGFIDEMLSSLPTLAAAATPDNVAVPDCASIQEVEEMLGL